jgi:Tfp pilus assembly protein PilE
MATWLIVLIVVVAVVVLALIALMAAKRNRISTARKREQAREHLQEAQVRAARADQQQALAEEQAARARREQAEAEERAARAQQEAAEMTAQAAEDRAAADQLRQRAEKLAPGLAGEQRGVARNVAAHPDGVADGQPVDGPSGSGSTRR